MLFSKYYNVEVVKCNNFANIAFVFFHSVLTQIAIQYAETRLISIVEVYFVISLVYRLIYSVMISNIQLASRFQTLVTHLDSR